MKGDRGVSIVNIHKSEDQPVSQICALTVFESTLIDRVANSTPMVDLDSRLNSLRVKRESTADDNDSIAKHNRDR